MKRCILGMCALVVMLIVAVGHSAASDPAVSLTTYFAPSVATPFDVLYHEDEADPSALGTFYIATLTMQDEREGIVSLQDARTSQRVLSYAVDTERGFRAAVQPHQPSALDDFFLDNYSEWCGKVHNGKKIKWQLCTGKDCPGGGICLKHCVKVAGTCIP